MERTIKRHDGLEIGDSIHREPERDHISMDRVLILEIIAHFYSCRTACIAKERKSFCEILEEMRKSDTRKRKRKRLSLRLRLVMNHEISVLNSRCSCLM